METINLILTFMAHICARVPSYISESSLDNCVLWIILGLGIIVIFGIFSKIIKNRNKMNREISTEARLLNNQRTNRTLITVYAIIIMALIIAVLILLCHRCSKLNEQVELMKKDNVSLADSISAMNSLLREIKNQNVLILDGISDKNKEIDSLTSEVKKQSLRISILSIKVSEMKEDIHNLQQKIDSLEGGMSFDYSDSTTDSLIDTTFSYSDVAENENYLGSRILSVSIEKTTMNKKSEITKTSLLNYSAPLTLVTGKGFEKDSLNYLYQYLNEKNDSLGLNFNSLIKDENLSVSVIKSSKDESLVLLNENKDFYMGAGGLLVEDDISTDIGWKYQFLEKTINPERRKKGNTEIIAGSGLIATGIFGYWYFDKHPMAVIDITRHGQSVFHDEIYNDFAKGVSIGVSALGAGFIVKGVIDKCLSFTLSQTEISLKYLLK